MGGKEISNSFYAKLAGVTYNNEGSNTESRQQIIRDLLRKGLLNPGQKLELRPDPTNRFDHQAVAVYGPDGRQMGFLPKEIAHKVFSKLTSTGGYSCFVSGVSGGGVGMVYGVSVRIEEYQVSPIPSQKTYTKVDALADYSFAKLSYVEKDFEKAIGPLSKAAEFGLPEAQFLYGTFFDYGFATEKDEAKASFWYLKAAEQGNADAQADLSYNYINGCGIEKDYQKALYWAQKAIAQDQPNAMVSLGHMYEFGKGVQQDYSKAFEYYKRAAELGNRDGAHNTGVALLIGRGVNRDPYEAAKWNTIAAEKGHMNAQFNLALQYRDGDGVPVDLNQAVRWMIAAANNGHPQARAILNGEG